MTRASCLFECAVMHRRLSPQKHEFVYRIFLFYLDIDELSGLARDVPILGINEPNLYSLRDEDYFRIRSGSLRENVCLFLRSEGFTAQPHRIRLLTLPRLLGYTFNPVSIFFCFDEDDRPLVSVIQVGNTFGELKPFLVPVTKEGDAFHILTPKYFYVSPFSDLDLLFDFRFENPSSRLRVAIDEFDGGGKTLISTLTGTRTELTLGNLIRLTVKYPLVTLKIIGLIHWEAFRLWKKGIPHRLKESDPNLQQGVFRTRENPPK